MSLGVIMLPLRAIDYLTKNPALFVDKKSLPAVGQGSTGCFPKHSPLLFTLVSSQKLSVSPYC